MPYDVSAQEEIALRLNETLQGERLSKLTYLTSDVCYFHLKRREKLVFSLRGNDPYVYLSKTLEDVTGIPSSFCLMLRKEIQNAEIDGVSLVNHDRIFRFALTAISSTFKPIARYLIAELLPGKTNLILLDEEEKILGAQRMGEFGQNHLILRGVKYLPPEKMEFTPRRAESSFSFEEYQSKSEAKEETVLSLRKKELYKPLFDFLKRKVRSGEKKLKMLETDKENAKTHLNDGDYGSFIFMNMDAIDPTSGHMDYYGEDIKLDPRKSASANAELFFKRAKKSKTALKMAEENRLKAEKDLEGFKAASIFVEHADEAVLGDLMEHYGLRKSKAKKKGDALISSASLPYFVSIDGTTYLFGKSMKQNDFLTFHLDTCKTHLWFHIEGDSGAHVMLRKDDPSQEEITLAAEIAIAASEAIDGTVMCALRKDVRKGNVPGQAVVSEYKTIRVNKISEKAVSALENARKISLK